MEQTTFGRRRTTEPPAIRPSSTIADPGRLSPEAEAFRAQLRSGDRAKTSEFAEWRKSQQGGRMIAWLLTLVLLAPGGLSFVLHAPPGLSGVLEAAGFGLGWWLRRARRRHLAQIVGWTGD